MGSDCFSVGKVFTILDEYEYDNKVPRSQWGNYSRFVDNYLVFKRAYNLEGKTFKEIDRFIWTYGKILADYWSDHGVLSFDSVQFDPRSFNE